MGSATILWEERRYYGKWDTIMGSGTILWEVGRYAGKREIVRGAGDSMGSGRYYGERATIWEVG